MQKWSKNVAVVGGQIAILFTYFMLAAMTRTVMRSTNVSVMSYFCNGQLQNYK